MLSIANIEPVAPEDYDLRPMAGADVEPFTTPWRRCEFREIQDGDTFQFLVDLGLETWTLKKFRLIGLNCGIKDGRLGVDTWESKGATAELGGMAMAFARHCLTMVDRSNLRILTRKTAEPDGAYGRWLGCVAYQNLRDGDSWTSLGDILLSEGHARVWWPGIAKQLQPIENGAPRPGTKKVRKRK